MKKSFLCALAVIALGFSVGSISSQPAQAAKPYCGDTCYEADSCDGPHGGCGYEADNYYQHHHHHDRNHDRYDHQHGYWR